MTPEEKEKLKRLYEVNFKRKGEYEFLSSIDTNDVFNWFVSQIEEREKAHKIELSNYAFQIDRAKRDHDIAESKVEDLIEARNFKNSQILEERKQNRALKEKLEAAEKVIELVTDRIYLTGYEDELEALEHYKSLKL